MPLAAAAMLATSMTAAASPTVTLAYGGSHRLCDANAETCAETVDPNTLGYYTGHDEPSVLFYSNQAGSGNSNRYRLRLPTDPPIKPNQSGTAGTYNFQLHPAFWFGMAMCDSQSAPNPGLACPPDSDANVFDGTNPNAPDYIGNHPGAGFMEMQFYPPGWVSWPAGDSCDATKWCAALNIDSLSENMNTGQTLNATCASRVGLEYVNFAFITLNGAAQAPANPVDATLATYTPDPTKDLFMNSGDDLVVDMHDTAHGFQVVISDRTTHQVGAMTASPSNGFGQVQFDPTGTSCNDIPYAFHPMYSTSSEHTRVPWAAHSYNVAFSDEIGHFEYCNTVDDTTGNCATAGANDPAGTDEDDNGCFDAADSSRIPIAGCLGTDDDFDGVPYQAHTWPGTIRNPFLGRLLDPSPIQFSSPTFRETRQYSRIAFETDLPRIELATTPACNRTTGANCVNPPVGAAFYPFFSTTRNDGSCLWQEGGPYLPNTTNRFGGSSSAEFGPLLQLAYPNVGGTPVFRYNDFRNVLPYNPCPSRR